MQSPLAFQKKIGDEFAITPFSDQPVEKTAYHEGKRYHQIIWENILTPVKAGEFDLQFQEDFVVGRSIFSQQQVAVDTEPLTLVVLPLPLDGKPSDFSGAIGNFHLQEPILSSDTAQVGEPITLTVMIDGTGNFSRISPPEINDTQDWRIYPPEESFNAKDPYGYEGAKAFEYILIPKHEGVAETPEINFNYFEPETAEYISQTLPPQVVTITPAPTGSHSLAQYHKHREVHTKEREVPELLPIAHEPGIWLQNPFRPVFFNPYFIAGQIIPFVALVGLIAYRRNKLRLVNDIDYAKQRRAKKQVKRYIREVQAAVSKQQSQDFYTAALRAIQEAAGPHFSSEPEAIIFSELEDYLKRSNFTDKDIKIINNYFQAGDALKFGRQSENFLKLDDQLQHLERLLKKLTTPK